MRSMPGEDEDDGMDEEGTALGGIYDDMAKASGQARGDELRGLYAPDAEAVPGAEDVEASASAPPPGAGATPTLPPPGMPPTAGAGGAGTIELTPEDLLALLQASR